MDYFNDKSAFGPGFQDLGYVLHNADGTPFHPDSITTKWRRFVEANGLDHIRLHDLRHTHATALIQAGVDAKVVQKRLGHSDMLIFSGSSGVSEAEAHSPLHVLTISQPENSRWLWV